VTYTYPFPAFYAAVTMLAYSQDKVLIGKRKPTSNAFPDMWCLPGGFVHTFGSPEGPPETFVEAAKREFKEETGLTIPIGRWVPGLVYSDPETDPRGHVINAVYVAAILPWEADMVKAADDLVELKWQYKYDLPSLAFNHNLIVAEH
jgi:ADP-ribose pyrophosphatase YjhB (NUDIX family)